MKYLFDRNFVDSVAKAAPAVEPVAVVAVVAVVIVTTAGVIESRADNSRVHEYLVIFFGLFWTFPDFLYFFWTFPDFIRLFRTFLDF